MRKYRYPNIDAERARHGMTRDALAKSLGVSRRTYYGWCVKGEIPSAKLKKLSKMFCCSVDYLLTTECEGGDGNE